MHPARKTIAVLAVTQILSWGSLYYAIAVLAPQIRLETGWRAEAVLGAFSLSLLVSGLVATPVGVLLDRHGGRLVMGAGSLVSGAGMLLLSRSHSLPLYFAAWAVLGLAMALTMYEAAFATINREFGARGRQAISTLTLFGGFASTVFWPLTQQLDQLLGWRDTYALYGALQIAVCLPLHLLLAGRPPAAPAAGPTTAATVTTAAERSHTLHEALRHPAFWKLALAFAANSFIFSAMSVQLIPMFVQFGHAPALAVALAALVGPMQVAGRVGEMTLGRHALPQTIGKFTFAALPAALLVLLLFGARQWALALYCTLYGLSNGILTIVKGTLPAALFGRENYGAIAGALAGPALVARAAGPLAVAAIIARAPAPAVLLTVLLGFALVSLASYLAATRQRVALAEAV
ncbi:MFS transporter [Rugamonas rubra]|uniref:Major Facilitator Superfamily protein n=1 Tax=Rugamonas rubra TaxID=758825 RepID=A0A1I4N1B5_9BURK|nr:MFS transporter [Rugamonas rubra]SFM09165.1 Major Facilitator Superfamily protein [Rugamonas rubra]